MICRLCLEKSVSNIEISNNGRTEVAEIITKYFHIEVQSDDIISNKICTKCWQHLFDFHRFYLSIDEKQKALQSRLEYTQIKQDVDVIDSAEFSTTHRNSIDYKNNEFVEREIMNSINKSNLITDSLEIAADEMKEEELSIDRESLLSSSIHSVDEQKPIQNKSTIKRKSTKKTNEIKLIKTLRSSKKTEEKDKSNDNEEPDLKLKEKSEKQRDTKCLIQEWDEYIAENAKLSCCLCAIPLKNFNDLKKHFRQVHHCGGYIPCCNNRYQKRALYVDHLKLHKDPDFFKCTLCDKRLASRHNYKNHMDTKHPDTDKLVYSCKSCPRKFAKQYILDYHLKYNHKTKRNFICKTCNKGFTNSAILKQHEKAVHLKEYDYICEICGKSLKTAQNLLTHMEDMHSIEPRPQEQCNICFRWLKNSRCMKKHMMAHRDQISGQKYKCPQCAVEKNTKPALAAHIRYHHSDKAFTCTWCNKEFKDPRGLREHETTHTGAHLYTCSFCPKTFRSYGNMHKHKVHSHSQEYVRCWSQPNETTKSLLNISVTDGDQI